MNKIPLVGLFDQYQTIKPEIDAAIQNIITSSAFVGGEEVRRNYSLCTAPDEQDWMVTVKRIAGGLFSNWVGDTLNAGDLTNATVAAYQTGYGVTTNNPRPYATEIGLIISGMENGSASMIVPSVRTRQTWELLRGAFQRTNVDHGRKGGIELDSHVFALEADRVGDGVAIDPGAHHRRMARQGVQEVELPRAVLALGAGFGHVPPRCSVAAGGKDI